MTDNEIIRALECCNSEGSIDCNRCPMWGGYATVKCIKNLLKNALDLSNRQKAEIKKLKKLLDNKCDRCIEQDKSEAIKEFAERLKEKLFYECGDINYTEVCDTKRVINNLVREMTEGKDNA